MRSLKVLLAFIFTILAVSWFVEPAYAATVTAPTSISANTTWTSDNVYVIPTYTVVQPGVQLTIQPGTVVKFQGSAYMNVKGTLDASGAADNNIVFTSYKDDEYGGDTNGDGTATMPAKGDWQFIESYTGGTVNCSYCRIRFGGTNHAMVYSYGGEVNVNHCIVEKSAGRAIETKGAANLTDNQLSDFITAIYVNSDAPTVSGNTMTGGNYGLYLANGASAISGNTITGPKYGIYVVNGTPTISNNNFNNCVNRAIQIVNGSPIISGNNLNGGSLADCYGIQVDNGTINIQNNTISQFPNHEAILLGSNGSNISGSIVGNTMNGCKYPLGFTGNKVPVITFDSNDFAGCSLLGINLNVSLKSQIVPAYIIPYIVQSLNINTGASVTIDGGAVFKMFPNVGSFVNGELVCAGDKEHPIIFTSLKDDSAGGDTNHDGSASTPQPYDWSYFVIGETKASFDWAELRYGSNGISLIYNTSELKVTNCDISRMSNFGIDIHGLAKVTVSGNKIHHNGNYAGYGVNIYGNGANTEITGNEFYNNIQGVKVFRSSSTKIIENYFHNNNIGIEIMMASGDQNNCLIEHNNFENNVYYGMENWTANNPPIAIAENNWWGSASGPYPLGSGDKINSTTLIDVTPWLTSPYVQEQPIEGVRHFCLHYDPLTRKWSLVLEPVDSGTGAHMIDKTLISLNGSRPIDFGLNYNSLMLSEGPMGKGWAHNYETRLEAQVDGSVKLRWSANRENDFTSTDQVNFTSSDNACRLDKLVKNVDGSYTLTRKDQSQYLFDTFGRLIEEKNSTGLTLQMTYDGNGKLQTISELLSDIALNLSYDSNGLLQSIIDNLSRQWSFAHDSSHNLTAIQYPNTTSSVFTYDTAGQILSETDPQGNLLFLNTYDDQGRVISQDDGVSGNQLSTISYDDTSQPGFRVTTITDRTGHSRQYIHDSSYQLVKVIDELGNQTQMAYDADGNRIGITDAAAHATTMTYDSRGNLLTSTDAGSNTTTMTYDDRNNVL
ncbi:MAG: right-handed parallel beta-helix repeat-containing protein, partial [Syntrophomonas sp.]